MAAVTSSVTQSLAKDLVAYRLALRDWLSEEGGAAEVVFRVCHQLHGAIGFCDESTISWISRYSQPLRRLPMSLSATRNALTYRVGRSGLEGLFSDPAG